MARRAPWGECQRCGLKYPLTKLRVEWSGLRVCPSDFDPRPAETRPPKYKPEGLVRRDAAPQTEVIYGKGSREDL